MGLWDKLTGTEQAKPGVAPVPAEQLLQVLLDLNRPSAPWLVREGTAEQCDLVAEWKIVDAQWQGVFYEQGLIRAYRVLLKLDQANHEVRNIDEQSTVEWQDGVPHISKAKARGQLHEAERGTTYGYTETGRFGEIYSYSFHSSEIINPLRAAVTDHGWGWKAVSLKL